MAGYSWTTGVSGDWNMAANEVQTVNALAMNAANNLSGSKTAPCNAAELAIDGTLNFAPGSTGLLSGSLRTYIVMNGGTIDNPGTLDGWWDFSEPRPLDRARRRRSMSPCMATDPRAGSIDNAADPREYSVSNEGKRRCKTSCRWPKKSAHA